VARFGARSRPRARPAQGRLRYFEAGTGSPIVFLHGLLMNANLWRKVVAELSPDFRCIAFDLALGSYLLTIAGVERNFKHVIKAVRTRYTNEAADGLGEFKKPALIALSREDRFFKPAHAEPPRATRGERSAGPTAAASRPRTSRAVIQTRKRPSLGYVSAPSPAKSPVRSRSSGGMVMETGLEV
jgi:hypothetical protein